MGNVTSIFPRSADDSSRPDPHNGHLSPIVDFSMSAVSLAHADAGRDICEAPSARELAARALCRHRRISETILLDGRPIWEMYLPEADAVLAALALSAAGPLAAV